MRKEFVPLVKKIEAWIKKKKVIDVILFGSAMRGKINPRDIDLCIMISDTAEEQSLECVDSLGKLCDGGKRKIHITILTASAGIRGNTLIKTLLEEGYSIMHKTDFAHVWGYQRKTLFIYSLKHFSPSQRVRFHYLLNGRYGMRGLLKEAGGKLVGTGTIQVSTEKEDILEEVLKQWNVVYTTQRVLWSSPEKG